MFTNGSICVNLKVYMVKEEYMNTLSLIVILFLCIFIYNFLPLKILGFIISFAVVILIYRFLKFSKYH